MQDIKKQLSADKRLTVGRQSGNVPVTIPDHTVPDHTVPDHTVPDRNIDPAKIPFEEIVAYLNEKADKGFAHQTPAHRKFIKARWKEGHGIEDFKTVIDNKVRDWKGKVNKDFIGDNFLRPSTLFGTKFDEYLQVPVTGRTEISNDELARRAVEKQRGRA